MLCDICKKQEAVLFLDHVNGSDRQKVCFCVACGVKTGIMTPDLKIDLFPKKLSENLKNAGVRRGDPVRSEKCPRCSTERAKFLETKTAGCPHCWDLFVVNAREFTKTSARYTGKRKRGTSRNVRSTDRRDETVHRLDFLRTRLGQLVNLERYEEAIKVRDAIRRMEKTSGHAVRKI